jgi:hypothetical protein
MRRPPRDLEKFTTPAGAAQGLKDLAEDIRKHTPEGTLVRWTANIRFWDPALAIPKKKREVKPMAGDGTGLENRRG